MRKCQATENVPTPALFLKVVCLPRARSYSINGLKSQVLKMMLKSSISGSFLRRQLMIANCHVKKICQKISVIKTNSFDWELLTFDDIKKIAHFGISSQVLS